ncbi:MAG: shikimate dehydrogenase [Micrococcales bacterium]
MDRQLAVLGSPIEHSKSPAIHSAAYRVLGLDWQYSKFEVREGGLSNFVDSLDPSWLGLSLTMPLKEEAARLAVSLDDFAAQTQTVNTFVRREQGWAGFNTDVFGIIQAIRQANITGIKTVLVIGSGATATSTMVAISKLAPSALVLVHARNETTRDKLVSFAAALGLEAKATKNLKRASSKVDLTISTLPAGSLDDLAAKLSASRFFKPRGAVFDVAYKPWPSPFAAVWIKNGKPAVSGLEMLIWQAVAQIRIFTSGSAEQPLMNEVAVVEAMRHAVS